MNRFEEIGRARKVQRLVEEIDGRLDAADIDKHSPHLADELAKWPLEAWLDLAEGAEPVINEPSSATVAAVIEFYRNRNRRKGAA